jgi:predicted RNase H-like nuclease (RuvC/YqgF family)
MQAECDHQGRECHQLRGELQGLSREYEVLSAEYVRLREDSSAAEREHLGQIALQNYDIERLVRECGEMKVQIEQLSSLRASSMYKST